MNEYLKKKKQSFFAPELSNTVNLLGNILGSVIKKQEGLSYFNKVEKIRFLSKASKNSKDINTKEKAFNKLKKTIINLNPSESLVIARSFTQFLNFAQSQNL